MRAARVTGPGRAGANRTRHWRLSSLIVAGEATATPGTASRDQVVPAPSTAAGPARLVVLVSGAGTNLSALLKACGDPGYGATVVAVGADRDGIAALDLARERGLPTFALRVADCPDRDDWDARMTELVAAHRPDLVVSAGFLKLAGRTFLDRFEGRYVNTHPALLPAFPGMHGAADALAYGVKVSGATLFVVDAGVDTGAILAQRSVDVHDDDTVRSLHERIKTVERAMLVETVGRMVRHGWSLTGRKVTIP